MDLHTTDGLTRVRDRRQGTSEQWKDSNGRWRGLCSLLVGYFYANMPRHDMFLYSGKMCGYEKISLKHYKTKILCESSRRH
jgi:hypothetical protein